MIYERRLALFLPDLSGGGAERVMLTLASAFAERGYDIDLVVAQEGGVLLPEVPSGVRLIALNKMKASRQGRFLLGIKSITRLARYLKDVRPAALLSAISGANFVALAAKELSRYRGRVVVTEVNTRRNFGLPFHPILLRYLYPRAHLVVAVSQGVAEDLSQLGLPDALIEVVPNPVNTDRVRTLASDSIDVPYRPGGGDPVVVTACRLVEAKGLETLIEAIACLQPVYPVNLVIIGDGPQRKTLEMRAAQLGLESRVYFAGFQSNPYAWMLQGDVFALSSKWEGFGLVIVEALALGLPVVSTDCPSGPAEILGHGRYGRLVAPGDVTALAGAIRESLEDPMEKQSLLGQAENYDVSAIADSYLKALLPS